MADKRDLLIGLKDQLKVNSKANDSTNDDAEAGLQKETPKPDAFEEFRYWKSDTQEQKGVIQALKDFHKTVQLKTNQTSCASNNTSSSQSNKDKDNAENQFIPIVSEKSRRKKKDY